MCAVGPGPPPSAWREPGRSWGGPSAGPDVLTPENVHRPLLTLSQGALSTEPPPGPSGTHGGTCYPRRPQPLAHGHDWRGKQRRRLSARLPPQGRDTQEQFRVLLMTSGDTRRSASQVSTSQKRPRQPASAPARAPTESCHAAVEPKAFSVAAHT